MPHTEPTCQTATDAAAFRGVLSNFTTGVVAVTALDPCGGQPTGLIANSLPMCTRSACCMTNGR